MEQKRVINVKEIAKECIRKWWIILLSAVILAMALAGIQYVNEERAYRNSYLEPDTGELREEFTPSEQVAVDNALIYMESLAQQKSYMENSILMQIDTSKESIITLQYYLDNGFETNYAGITGRDTAPDLIAAYGNYINTGTIAADVKNAAMEGVEARYIAELITFRASGNNVSNPGSFLVNIIGVEEESTRSLADAVKESIASYKAILDNNIESHDLNLVNESYRVILDNDLLNTKTGRADSIQRMQTNITNLQNSMNSTQLQYLNARENEMGDQESESTTGVDNLQTNPVTINRKYIVLGLGAGAFLSLLVIILIYLLRGTIDSPESVEAMYGLRILGIIGDTEKKNHAKEDKNEYEHQFKFLTTNIKNTIEIEKYKQIYVGKSNRFAIDTTLFDKLEIASQSGNLPLTFGRSFLEGITALESMAASDGVILIERERFSRYEDLEKEVKLCSQYRKPILGVIWFQ